MYCSTAAQRCHTPSGPKGQMYVKIWLMPSGNHDRYATVLREALDKVENGKMSPYVQKNIDVFGIGDVGLLRMCEVRIERTGEMRPE